MNALFIDRLKARLARLGGRPRHPWLGPIDLGRCVARESRRVQRVGGEFSIVLFCLEGAVGEEPHMAIQQFTRLLDRRARLTDTLGWISADHLCVLLPATTAAGADKFGQDVMHLLFKPRSQAPAASRLFAERRTLYRVNSYPSTWFLDSGEDFSQLRAAVTTAPADPLPAPLSAASGRRGTRSGLQIARAEQEAWDGLNAI